MIMTEQEIISFLKENRRTCLTFVSFPTMVKDWCNKHKDEKIFIACFDDGWEHDKGRIGCVPPYAIIALHEDYKTDADTKELKTYILERMKNDSVFREQASELINLFENDLHFRQKVKDMIIGTSKVYCKCVECKRIFKYSDSVYPLDEHGRPGWCVCSSCFSNGLTR